MRVHDNIASVCLLLPLVSGLRVQSFVADYVSAQLSENSFVSLICIACGGAHLVNPTTAKVVGAGDEGGAGLRDRSERRFAHTTCRQGAHEIVALHRSQIGPEFSKDDIRGDGESWGISRPARAALVRLTRDPLQSCLPSQRPGRLRPIRTSKQIELKIFAQSLRLRASSSLH
jgi:hypothetical protein